MTLLEIALDDIAGVRIAERAGAQRIELCAGLEAGGTTPSIGLVRSAAQGGIPAMVLVRPRAGDFVYSAEEVEVMLSDIQAIRAFATTGFVIGALDADGEIDVPTTARLVEACGDAPTTFHKAFDSTRDLGRSLDTLVELGIGRVLSSGGRRTALEGAAVLRSLVERADDRLTVVAGGGVRARNVAELVAESGVHEVHCRAALPRPSASRWRNPEQDYESAELSRTDEDTVRALLTALGTDAAGADA